MRPIRQRARRSNDWLLLAIAALALGVLVPGVRSGAAPQDPGTGGNPSDPLATFERAWSAFQNGEYRVASDLAARLEQAPEGVDPGRFAWLQAASVLRLGRFEPDSRQAHARQALERLALEPATEWGARAYAELVRQGSEPGGTIGPLEPVLTYWERRTDIPAAVPGYVDLAEALLGPDGLRRGATPYAGVLLRMWSNLIEADAPLPVLEDLGERLLGLSPGPAVPRVVPWIGDPGPGLDARVARDLLTIAREPSVRAHAAFVAGRAAEAEGDLVAAVDLYRRAVEFVGPDDSAAARQASQRLEVLTAPSISLDGAELFRPGSHHRFVLQWRNLAGWELELRRVDLAQDLEIPSDEHRTARLDQLIADGAGEVVWSRTQEDLREVRARQDGPARRERHQPRDETVWIDPLEPGVYTVVLRGRAFEGESMPAVQRRAFVVTALGVLERGYRPDGNEGTVRELWLVDMDGGEPIAGAELTVERGHFDPATRQTVWNRARARTGRDGRVLLEGDEPRTAALVVHGAHGGQPILFAGYPNGFAWSPPETIFRTLVWTDRPLYRPGETLNVQAFVRELAVRARELAVPTGSRVIMKVIDPSGETWDERTLEFDDNGSFDVALRVPASIRLGTHRITLTDADGARWSDTATFEVGEVRLPEFSVTVQLDDERRFVMGDTIAVEITAEYLFGGPVAGEVRVTATEEPVWHIWRPWRHMPWVDAEPAGRIQDMRIWPGRGAGETVAEERLVLGPEGRATLRIPTSGRGHEVDRLRYTIEATVTDVSRRQETGRGSVTVGRHELFAHLVADRAVVAPGDRASLRLRIEDAMDRGVAHEGTIEVVRLETGERERSILQRGVRTDDDGQAVFDFTPERTGHYRATFRGVDGRGHEMEAAVAVYVADPRTTDIRSRDTEVQLIVEEPEVIGDVARVLLLTDVPGRAVLFTRTHAGGSEVEVLRPRGTSMLIEIPLDVRHRPAFELQATSVSDFRVHESRVTIAAPAPDRLLGLDVEFDAESFRPGERAPLTVRAVDAQGNPVRTLLSLAVVDQALLQIAPRPELDPLRQLLDTPRESVVPPRSMGARHGGYALLDPDDEAEPQRGVPYEEASKAGGRGPMLADDPGLVSSGAVMAMRAADSAAPSAEGQSFTPSAVRTDFRTTALWRTGVATDADGRATVDVPLAESLTTWDATVLAVDPATRVGVGNAKTRTNKPIMVRLQHPRVFRGDDRFTVAAIVHNETDTDTQATVQIDATPLTDGRRVQTVLVPAHGQARVEWMLTVPFEFAQVELVRDALGRIVAAEPASIQVEAAVRSEAGDDALRRTVPVLPFGTGLHVASIREAGPGSVQLTFEPIDERLPGSERVTLTVAPSMLSAAIDALPGLAEFPYGCTEQTLSRFVPAVAVRAVAQSLGVRSERFDPELDAKISEALDLIAGQQNTEGGWGWWGGIDRPTNPYITAYVLLALSEAHDADVDVDTAMMRRGREALRGELPGLEIRTDDLAYALNALARADRVLRGDAQADDAMRRWAQSLLDRRDQLTPYARALTAMVWQAYGDTERASTLVRLLENDVLTNDTVDTAHWGLTRDYYWRGRGAVETTSFALQAIVAVDPDHPRRDAVARWLVLNRRGHQWDSTRSSAHALYALCDHLRGSTELEPDYTLIARQDGTELVRVRVDRTDLIDGGGRFDLPASVLDGGPITLELEGTGRAYVTFDADAFSRARQIEPSGNVVRVRRDVVRLDPKATLGQGIVDFEVPVAEGDSVRSGDRLRVRLHVEADHDVDFLMVDDPRIAGAEPMEQLSGRFHSGSLHGHREIRDARTVFFVDTIREGEHVIEYEVVAESPGAFHVAPTRALGMYLPDVAGHSARTTIAITSKPETSAQERRLNDR